MLANVKFVNLKVVCIYSQVERYQPSKPDVFRTVKATVTSLGENFGVLSFFLPRLTWNEAVLAVF